MNKQHGNTGNKNRAVDEPLNTGFSGRCSEDEKKLWKKAQAESGFRSLGEWLRDAANKAAKEQGFE